MAIDYQKRDGVAYITLNNPAKANILDKATSDEISAAWIDLWEDREIRCAILTGDLTHFGDPPDAFRVVNAVRAHCPNVLAVTGNLDFV